MKYLVLLPPYGAVLYYEKVSWRRGRRGRKKNQIYMWNIDILNESHEDANKSNKNGASARDEF